MSIFAGVALPKVLYQTHSEMNGDIEVVESGETRRLRVNKITQSINYDSPMAERLVWGRCVKLLQDEEPNLRSVLILGLGGGTMQHLISQRFPGVSIVTVDIDPVMVDVANQYFGVESIPNHTTIIADACRVIVEPEHFGLNFQTFDAVIVDILLGDQYPDLGTSGNFLSHICKMVVPAGLVVINRLYLEDHQEDVNMFVDNVEEFMHDVNSIIIPGKTNSDNILIYGRV